MEELKWLTDNQIRDAQQHTLTVIGDDFNAWAGLVLEPYPQFDLTLANSGSVNMFRRQIWDYSRPCDRKF